VISVDESSFRRQMTWLASSSTKVVALADILHTGGDAVALTFDDGFVNFAETALPVLEELQLPATLFVVTARAGSTNDWDSPSSGLKIPVLPLLDWAGINSVAARGIEIGAHSRTHRDLTAVSAARMADEISGSRDDLVRETGRSPRSFAFPYGAWNDAASENVRKVFPMSCTTEFKLLGAAESGALLPRIDAYYLRGNRRLESFGTHEFSRFVAGRRFARAVRRSMEWRRPSRPDGEDA
jgi:peptidoglycan/xylan/chitin deacetylase (PgdA/CDA1 family)